VLLPAALILYIVPTVLSLSRSVSAQVLQLAIGVIAGVVYQGVVVNAVRDIQDGKRDLSIGGLFRSVSPVLAPLLWTAILFTLGVGLGIFALIIPGLVLLTWWSVAAPVVVIERRSPTEALGRSRELVRGNGWQVFGVLLVTLLIAILVETLFFSIARGINGTVAFTVASLLGGVVTAPLFALASAVLYLALTEKRGEGLAPDADGDLARGAGADPDDPVAP
jgi:hypothetical protein